MAGTLGTHSVGGFQISGQAAGGAVTTANASAVQSSPSTSATSSASRATASANPQTSAPTTSATSSSGVTTASASSLGTQSVHGTLGSGQLGSTYLSGNVADGNVQSAAASVLTATATTSTTGVGSKTTVTADDLLADSVASSTGGGITTASAGVQGTQSTRGRLGYWTLGGTYISNQVQADASVASVAASPLTASPSTSTTGVASITTVTVNRLLADSFSSSTGGGKTTATGSTFGRMDRTRRLGEFTLGSDGTELGDDGEPLTATTSNPTPLTVTASPLQAIRFLDEWAVEGKIVEATISETRVWDELEITWRVSKDTLNRTVGDLKKNAGKVDSTILADGTFKSFDRVGGANTYTIKAPTPRNDVRSKKTWRVDDYKEEIVDQSGGQYEVTVKLIPDEAKTP